MRRTAFATTSLLTLTLALGACGGGSTDKDKLTQIVKAYGKDPTKLCTMYATPAMVARQFGTEANCVNLASNPSAPDPGVKVDSVTVKGNTAVVIRTSEAAAGKGSKAALHFIKTPSGWKVDAILPTS
jgi:hypothetical protein